MRENGVVGAGGAGFPTYVKASSKAEILVVNAAECEPLLRKDQTILSLYPDKVLDGVQRMMEYISAEKAIIGIKAKHEKIVSRLKNLLKKRKNMEISQLKDYYPAGDEFCLVYDTTGRNIPMGALPLDVGVVVNNVETLLNVAGNMPVTEKFLTVTGAVRKPFTSNVPVGIRWAELIKFAGGALCGDFAAIDGGPMMGKVITDFSLPVTKTSSGLIVLPKKHPLIAKKARGEKRVSQVGKSACDQCSYCTEFCPRYLLGHKLNPHRAMRHLLFSSLGEGLRSEFALLCSGCSLCSLYSCPENLDPSSVCEISRRNLAQRNIGIKNSALDFKTPPTVHPLRAGRQAPVKKLVRKLDLLKYDAQAPFVEFNYPVQNVKIMLSQHIGAPAKAVVSEGQSVAKGDVIAHPAEGNLAVSMHASISGIVTKVTSGYIEITNE